MTLDSIGKPTADTLSGRFFLVSYLPTYAAALFLLTLAWAGAPGDTIRFDRAWRTATKLGAGELVLIALAIALVALVTHPLQLSLVRLLEGSWPRWLAPLTRRMRHRQIRRRTRLAATAELSTTLSPPTQADVDRAGAAGSRLRVLFPREQHVRPTALGNILAATEDTAGRAYGWDATIAWSRLYPVLGDHVRAIVDDRRNVLDAAARLSVVAWATTIIGAGLLVRSGWWILLALVPLAVSGTAYAGALRAALAYGDAVHAAFDLHRFDLLHALRLAPPDNREAEVTANQELCAFWRQGKPIPLNYVHGEP